MDKAVFLKQRALLREQQKLRLADGLTGIELGQVLHLRLELIPPQIELFDRSFAGK